MSCIIRKPAFCICDNKGTVQLHCNHTADQLLCFCYIEGTISLLPKPEFQASSHLLWLYSPVCGFIFWKARNWFSHDAGQIVYSVKWNGALSVTYRSLLDWHVCLIFYTSNLSLSVRECLWFVIVALPWIFLSTSF